MKETEILFRNRQITAKDIETIQQIIRTHWEEGRTAISRHLCQQWNWRQPNGHLKDQVCRLLLLKLEKEGHILLPPRKISPNNKQKVYYRRRPEVLQQISMQPIEGSLGQLMPIELRQVRKTPEEPLWNELVYQYHYLQHRVLVGSHLQYIAYAHGRPIACLGWGAAIWAVRCRDTFIGWTKQDRQKNLRYVVNNNRFLILPWVFCKNLASYLLSSAIQRIAQDWEERYGYPLYLLETFVDRSRFTGACYRASNWLFVGQTAGYAKRLSFYYHGQKKDVYLYPLTAQFREKLCET